MFFVDFSEKKKSDSEETEKSSKNSSKQKQTPNNDQSPEHQPGQRDTNKSILSGGAVGRGKKK